jgi:hypothetical protein
VANDATPDNQETVRQRLEPVPGLPEQLDRLDALSQRIAAEVPEAGSEADREKQQWLQLIGYLEGLLGSIDLALISEGWVGELTASNNHLEYLLNTYGLASPANEKTPFVDFVRRSVIAVNTEQAAQRLSAAAQAARLEEQRLRTTSDALAGSTQPDR